MGGQTPVLSPACALAVLQLHVGAKPYDSNHHPSASSPPREGNAGMQTTRPHHMLVSDYNVRRSRGEAKRSTSLTAEAEPPSLFGSQILADKPVKQHFPAQ